MYAFLLPELLGDDIQSMTSEMQEVLIGPEFVEIGEPTKDRKDLESDEPPRVRTSHLLEMPLFLPSNFFLIMKIIRTCSFFLY